MDDYAHHPTEIMASLAVKNMKKNRIFCLIPTSHLYQNKNSIKWIADAFKLADEVVVIDIYAAREVNTLGVHSRDFG